MRNRVVLLQRSTHTDQGVVLRKFEAVALQTLQLNADGIVIAVVAPLKIRLASMPGTVIATHKLPQFAIATDIKVRRHLHTPNRVEIRVRVPIQRICKKLLHFITTVLTRRQADGVDHDQIHERLSRPFAKVGRCLTPCKSVPAILP